MIRKASLLVPVIASLVLGGCATFALYMPAKEGGPDYVIVKTLGNNEKVYDCYSNPNGDVWDPTCVKVKFRQQGVAQEKRGVRTEERVDDYKDKRKSRRGEEDEGE